MGITGIIFLVLLIVALGVFIFLLVKSARGWGALQVTMLVFIFLSTIVFLFEAAGVSKRRNGWIKIHDKLIGEIQTLQNEETKLRYGDLNVSSKDQAALVPALAELNRLTADRGRVWRNVALRNADGSGLQVELTQPASPAVVPPPGGNQPAAQAPIESLPAELVVYAFSESPDETGRMVPNGYLGEYVVSEVQGAGAKLVPTQTLHPLQLDIISSGAAAQITIYELMPIDSHQAFAAKGSEPGTDEIFGRMDREELAKLFFNAPATEVDIDVPAGASPLDPAVRRAILFRSYLLDGQKAPENAPPGSVWVEVEFTQPYEIDVDSNQDRPSTEGGFFDIVGRTVDNRLKRNKDGGIVKFAPGDKRIFLKEAADKLTEGGANPAVARAIRNIYVRPLNNYEYAYRMTRQRMAETLEQIELMKREREIIQATALKGQEQLTVQQAERQKLDKDLSQVEKERDVAVSEVKRLDAELASLNRSVRDIYQSMKARYEATIAGRPAAGGLAVPAAP